VRPQPANPPVSRVAMLAPATRAVAAISASNLSIGLPARLPTCEHDLGIAGGRARFERQNMAGEVLGEQSPPGSVDCAVLIRPTDLMADARRSPPLSASGRGRRYSSAAATGVEFISGLCYTSNVYCVLNKHIESASGAKCQPEVFLPAPSGPVIRSLLAECSFGCLRL
jgi:hypothetical protein